MKRLICTCDHCGKNLEKHDYVKIKCMIEDRIHSDLCKDCYQELSELIKKFVGREIEKKCDTQSK